MISTCLQCGSKSTLYFQAKDLNQKIDKSSFNYYRCIQCKLIFLDPIPTNLSDYYSSEYQVYKRIPHSLEQLARLEKELHWRVLLVQRYKNKGNLLEIGSSYGTFAYGTEQAGFQVDAIEGDKSCCDFINAITKVVAINATDVVGTMSRNQKTYDVITMWHSIEHMPNPWAVLKQCEKSLRPGGVLIISTPNPDSIQFKLFRRYWVHLDAPRHLGLIPPALVSSFLSKMDMRLVFTTTNDPDGLTLNNMGWYNSTLNLFGTSSEKNITRKIVSRLLRLTISPFERLMQRGAAYTAVYQKS